MVRTYAPPLKAAGVPVIVAVPSRLSVKVTPLGSEPTSLSAGVGTPVVVTVNVPDWRVWNAMLFALVNAGACCGVNPVACVNGDARVTPSASSAPVVTRILYVALTVSGAVGWTVKMVLPPLTAGAAFICTQEVKLSEETCRVPRQTGDPVFVVIDPGVTALLKVTLIAEPTGTPVAPSVGEVDDTASAGCVVKPAACVNCEASATPLESCASVVTRSL